MGNPNKDSDGATGDLTSPRDARQAAHNLSQEREARDTALAKQVVEAIEREIAKAHTHYQALLNDRGATAIKMTSRALGFKVMDPFDWTKLSTRDGKCGQKRLDTPLMLWKVTQKRLKFHTSTTGLTVKEWPRLSHGRIKRYSSARRTLRNLRKMKKKASTLQKR